MTFLSKWLKYELIHNDVWILKNMQKIRLWACPCAIPYHEFLSKDEVVKENQKLSWITSCLWNSVGKFLPKFVKNESERTLLQKWLFAISTFENFLRRVWWRNPGGYFYLYFPLLDWRSNEFILAQLHFNFSQSRNNSYGIAKCCPNCIDFLFKVCSVQNLKISNFGVALIW